MGMYDELRCHYPLPVAGANARNYQTKDTPSQDLHKYEITVDGVLRHNNRIRDGWIEHPDFTDEVYFYDYETGGGWIEFAARFVNGVLKDVRLISNTTKGAVDKH